MTRRIQHGFTLVELVIFITVAAVLAVALTAAFSTVLRESATPGQLTQAALLAQERMELILAQRRAVGFAAFADPCNPGPAPSECTPPYPTYVVVAAINDPWPFDNNTTRYRLITVTVTGPSNATLTTLVANF